MKKENLTGRKFGRLTVLEEERSPSNRLKWRCQCECGGFCSVSPDKLKSGHTKSCGCYHRERAKTSNQKTNSYVIKGETAIIIDGNDNQAIIDRQYLKEAIKYCWRLSDTGYFRNSEGTYLHQLIIQLRGEKYIPFKNHIDHIDQDKRNNLSANLRVVLPCHNALNRDRDNRNTTGFLGVVSYGNKYRSSIQINGKRYSKAGFDTPEAAYEWRLQTKEMMTYQ